MAIFNPTTGFITALSDNELVVVGTNSRGDHAGGLAYQAMRDFGLEVGVSHGVSGQCYAVNTMDTFDTLADQLTNLLIYATDKIGKEVILLTPIGQGIAGMSEESVNNALAIANYDLGHTALPVNLVKVGW